MYRKDNHEIAFSAQEISKYILALASALGVVVILAWLIFYSGYGIDFTDEGYYLVKISNPFQYTWGVTLFDFVYHPIHLLLREDISYLRVFNVLITFFAAWVAFFSLLTKNLNQSRNLMCAVVSAGFSVSSLTVFEIGLVTPSYNTLALQALLVTASGLLLADETSSRTSLLGWVLIGVGGWLAFMAKPSTAAALAVGVSLYLAVSRIIITRLLLVSIGSALILLVTSALLIDGSIVKFAERIKTGVLFSSYLQSGHDIDSIFRLEELILEEKIKGFIWKLGALGFVATICMTVRGWASKSVAVLASLSFVYIIYLVVFKHDESYLNLGIHKNLLIWAVVFPSALVSLIFAREKLLFELGAPKWSLALLFVAMPYAYVIGTNGLYWAAMGAAGVFWVLGGLVLLGPVARSRDGWDFALPLTLGCQAITAVLLLSGMEHPYRQPQPLRLNNHVTEVGPRGARLTLSEAYGKYIEEAKASAAGAGWEPGTPLIDLTGQSPGILYALGAKAVGQGWTIGGYPGSDRRAVEALRLASCSELAVAWVLFEKDGPRNLSAQVVEVFGAHLQTDYVEIASWPVPGGVGGYDVPRTQTLYKPLRALSAANTSCIKSKAGDDEKR